MNPILPHNICHADPTVRRMPDGRFYIYGDYDIYGAEDFWTSDKIHVFSSDNLRDWVDHGVCFQIKDISWEDRAQRLFAPDCVYWKGKYYLYFCMSVKNSASMKGVAVSDTPYGYFHDPKPIDASIGIDPSVFIDDDGQAYYFWGQLMLKGARMNPDMCSIDPGSVRDCIISERQEGFHEGACVRKRGGLYYLIYTDISRGHASCMSYAVSRSPLGPYEKRGVIIDNVYCDPGNWNNEGSILEVDGQWYVFYHRSSQNGQYNRRSCMEKIFFDENGDIQEVKMTTQGIDDPLPMNQIIPAASACMLRRGGYIAPSKDQSYEILGHLSEGSYAAYRYIHFQNPKRFLVHASCIVPKAELQVWADNTLLGVCELHNTHGWEKWEEFSCSLKQINGVKTLYLEVHVPYNEFGSRLVELLDFCIEA